MYEFKGELSKENELYINKVMESSAAIIAMDFEPKVRTMLLACCRCGKPQIEIMFKKDKKQIDLIRDYLKKGAKVAIDLGLKAEDMTFEKVLNLVKFEGVKHYGKMC